MSADDEIVTVAASVTGAVQQRLVNEYLTVSKLDPYRPTIGHHRIAPHNERTELIAIAFAFTPGHPERSEHSASSLCLRCEQRSGGNQ